MYRRILLNKNLSLKERFKRFIEYYKARRGARIAWKIRYRKVFNEHPDFKMAAERPVERSHKEYWKPFNGRINLSTLRMCKSITGISDPKYFPEEIFITDIEPTLNQTSSVEYLTFKSLYNRWFPGKIFPYDYFHNVDGEWLDHNLDSLAFNEVKLIAQNLDYPVVIKPNRDSLGGKNIFYPKNFDELMILIKNKKDFLVQEKIRQHSFFEQFNPHGINSLRTNVYRSVTDNRPHVVNTVLRMGVGGSLDNETAGGVVSMVRNDGYLNGFALDKYGKKYLIHPDTGANFKQRIPDHKGLIKTSLDIAQKIFYARLICLDLCYDAEGKWRMIEVNINGATIRFAQYHGSRFFDQFTEEVYEYCLNHHWALK